MSRGSLRYRPAFSFAIDTSLSMTPKLASSRAPALNDYYLFFRLRDEAQKTLKNPAFRWRGGFEMSSEWILPPDKRPTLFAPKLVKKPCRPAGAGGNAGGGKNIQTEIF